MGSYCPDRYRHNFSPSDPDRLLDLEDLLLAGVLLLDLERLLLEPDLAAGEDIFKFLLAKSR